MPFMFIAYNSEGMVAALIFLVATIALLFLNFHPAIAFLFIAGMIVTYWIAQGEGTILLQEDLDSYYGQSEEEKAAIRKKLAWRYTFALIAFIASCSPLFYFWPETYILWPS